jgi:hypothetical protein
MIDLLLYTGAAILAANSAVIGYKVFLSKLENYTIHSSKAVQPQSVQVKKY